MTGIQEHIPAESYDDMPVFYKRCHNEGYYAGLWNISTTACDYRNFTRAWEAWWTGFSAGKREREERAA